MDEDKDSSFGDMELLWCKSYNGSRIEYLDQETYCYLNGKNIILSSMQKPFVFPGKGISAFAVHKLNKHIAIGSRGLNPDIHIYSFPSFENFTVLPSCAKLEYSAIAFSSTDYLACLSGIPDFQLCFWDYKNCNQLSSMKMPDEIPVSLSFNPGSWRQLSVIYTDQIHCYNIVRCHTHLELRCKIIPCPPLIDEPTSKHSPTRTEQISSVYNGLQLTEAAKAGEIGERVEKLPGLLKMTKHMTPLSQCWLFSGILYIGCKEGYILKVDGDSDSAKILFHPSSIDEEIPDDEKQTDDDNSEQVLSIDFIAVHRTGLFAASKNGIIQQFDIFGENPKLLCQCIANTSISTFTFTPDYEMILLGSPQGIIQLHNVNKLEEVKLLFNENSSPFLSVKSLYPGTKTAVSIQQDGLLQLWNIEDGQKISSLPLNNTLCSMSSSPVSYIVAIGCAKGYVCIIDISTQKQPRVIHCAHLCNASITHIQFDYNGDYIFSVSENNYIFIQDGSGINGYKIYGYLNSPGHVSAITNDTLEGVDVYITLNNEEDNKKTGAHRLFTFHLESEFKENYSDKYLSQECDFDPCKLHTKFFTLLSPVHGLTSIEGEVYVHSQKSCKIVHLPLNEEGIEALVDNTSEFLSAQEYFDSHQLPGIDLHCSDDQKWLISCGKDGLLQFCLTNDMDKTLIKYASHDFYQSCAKSLILTSDCLHVLLTSQDGSISCYKINYKSEDAIENFKETEEWLINKKDMTKTLLLLETRAIAKICTVTPFENAKEEEEEPEAETSPTEESTDSSPDISTPPLNGSWLEIMKAKHLHEKNKQFAAAKKHIKDSIKQMRQTVKKMLIRNAKLPEIEQLERYEFDLDVEEQTRLQQEAKEAVLQVYERIEQENLTKLYLKDIIKRQCFDTMKVKGRTIKAFLIPLEVTNFPLIERSLKTHKNLEIFQKRRNIEIQVDAINKEIMESLTQPVISPSQEEEAPAVIQDLPSTDGSLGALYGGGSEYLYDQFDLHSRYQKIAQIILLQDVLYRIKETFNKEFDELYQRKEMEISRIKEKNKRITQIIKDLEVDEKIYVPDMSVHEKPELLLVVEDSEVKTEKYLTPEQKKALEEKMAEEERKKKDKSDNVRERALNHMMNGVLEIKKEDELKKDIPLPNITTKEEDWTEEEIKIMKEYERKVKELNEEREKYRKNLETELKKMQGSIVESMMAFDELLNNLFLKHIQVVKAIHQEELKINRIKLNLMVQNVLDCQEKELIHRMQEKLESQNTLFNALAKSEKMISDYRTCYDQIVSEDKAIDKTFKNEFPGVSQTMVDTLHKLFRKRPKAYKFKGTESLNSNETEIVNIFHENPSSQKPTAQSNLEAILEEMDRFFHMPEGLDPKIWMKFCQIRRAKFLKEQQVRNSALTLAEINAFHQEKIEGNENLRNEIEEIEVELKKLKRRRQQFDIDIEIQLLLKQGQVELETETFIYNFLDSVIIHRCIVEELNGRIKELAEQKISSMEESKEFKKGIFQQEWEHRKMMMEMEDLRQKMNNIQFLKVTREVQEYLALEDYDGKKSFETEQLEKSLSGIREIHNRKFAKIIEDIKRLRMMVFQKQKDNESFSKQIEILNVEVNDRYHITDVSSEKREYLQTEKKYRTIKQRKKLVDLAKSQAAELAVLRKEVERLRMKTFPALL